MIPPARMYSHSGGRNFFSLRTGDRHKRNIVHYIRFCIRQKQNRGRSMGKKKNESGHPDSGSRKIPPARTGAGQWTITISDKKILRPIIQDDSAAGQYISSIL